MTELPEPQPSPRNDLSSNGAKEPGEKIRPRPHVAAAIAATHSAPEIDTSMSETITEEERVEEKRPQTPEAAQALLQEAMADSSSYHASYSSHSYHERPSLPQKHWRHDEDRPSSKRHKTDNRKPPTGPRRGNNRFSASGSQSYRRPYNGRDRHYSPAPSTYGSPPKAGNRSPRPYDNHHRKATDYHRSISPSSRSRDRDHSPDRSPPHRHRLSPTYSPMRQGRLTPEQQQKGSYRGRSPSLPPHSTPDLRYPSRSPRWEDRNRPRSPLPESYFNPTPMQYDPSLFAPGSELSMDTSALRQQLQEEQRQRQNLAQELADVRNQLAQLTQRHIKIMYETTQHPPLNQEPVPLANTHAPQSDTTPSQDFVSQSRVQEMQLENEMLQHELTDMKAELQTTKDTLDDRTLELRGSNAFLTKADASSNSDCVRLIEGLNQEIDQASAGITDRLVIESDRPIDSEVLSEAEALVQEMYGQPMLSYMRRNRETPDHGLTQYVLAHCLVKSCHSLLSLWTWNADNSRPFQAVYEKLRTASTPQPVAGRWRSLTHAQTKPHDSMQLATICQDLTGQILKILAVNGYAPSDDVTRMCEDRTTSIVKALVASDKVLMEDVTSVDLEAFVVSNGDPYDEKVEDTEGTAQSSEEQVAFSTALGLFARNTETDETRILLKSKAFLQSTIDDLLG